MSIFGKKELHVNTIYGADGQLNTSYIEGKAAVKAARRNVKAFNKQLAKYDRDFVNYASLDIDESKIADKNTKYILGKLGIAEKYVAYMPTSDAAMCMGDDMTAIAGNKHMPKLGVGAKVASVFQPFFEKQASKHPRFQKLSDCITKAANNGRMPLTSESAAMMRIAFDKKYYNDLRLPGADKDALKMQYERAVENLTTMARFDGVDMHIMSEKYGKKIIQQMSIDESLSDIYSGFANGDVRLARSKSVFDAYGNEITINGKTLYGNPEGFIRLETDEKTGKLKDVDIDAWSELRPREPQSVSDIMNEYRTILDKYASACRTEAEFKKMLASDSYRNIERNAKTFAAADCPDDADYFNYEFARTNLKSCRDWAVAHDNKSPYAQLVIPPPYKDVYGKNDFIQNYSVGDYYSIGDVHRKAAEETTYFSDTDLAESLKDEMTNTSENMSDVESNTERIAKLEAENAELRSRLGLTDDYEHSDLAESIQIDEDKSDAVEVVLKDDDFNRKVKENGLITGDEMAENMAQMISEQYGSSHAIIPEKKAYNSLKQRFDSYLPGDKESSESEFDTKSEKISLLSIEQNGERISYLNDMGSMFEAMKAVASNHDMKDYKSAGVQLSDEQYAEYEQSDRFSYSINVNLDENCVTVYEAAGVSEADRNDDNTRYNRYEMSDIKEAVTEIMSTTSDLSEQMQLFAEKRFELENRNVETNGGDKTVSDDISENLGTENAVSDSKQVLTDTARYDVSFSIPDERSHDSELTR